jgi:hypothetical protein
MKPTASKNRELIAQYPFLSTIMKARMEPFGGEEGCQVDDLTIAVQKADGDLMWRQVHNTGLGDNSCFFSSAGKRKGQLGRQGEYLFAVDANNRVINLVEWPRNDEERRDRGEVYAWSALWRTEGKANDGSNMYSNPLWSETKYLVWVTVETWHKDTGDHDAEIQSRFGKLCDRSLEITIFAEPAEGFEKLQDNSPLLNHLCLDSKVTMRAVFDRNYDIITICGRLDELCTMFQDEVYFNGMKDVLDKGNVRGASGQFGPVKVLCAEMCGYDRVMLEDSNCFVTYQLRPDAKHMYVLGMRGTLPNIRRITKTVIKMWNGDSKNREVFGPDKKVSVM